MTEAQEYVLKSLSECQTPKERTERAKKLSGYYGVSLATVWRWAKAAGYSARKERSDKGKTAVSDELLDAVASRVYISKRLSGNFTNSVKNACEQLAAEGWEIPCSISWICKLLKRRGLDKKTLKTAPPHQKLISLHPNHVWQFDVTNCLKYHFSKNGMRERDADSEFYKNKLIQNAKKVKKELLRFVMRDHCSGAFFMWYYYTTGERAEDGADFFYRAFAPKHPLILDTLGMEHPGAWQMHGVPFMLVSDKGSILKQKTLVNLMRSLNVKVELHAAGNPRAKGGVEGFMAEVDEKFETILKVYNPETLEELNAWTLAWCVKYNQEAVFRRNKNRASLWLKIRREELRICPDYAIFRTLLHRPAAARTINGNCQLSYDGKTYSVPYTDWARQKVLVVANAYEYPAVDIHFNGLTWTAQPETADEYGRVNNTHFSVVYGEYKAMPQTENQKNIARLENVAKSKWNVEHEGHMQKRRAVPPKQKENIINKTPAAVRPEPTDEKIAYFQPSGVAIRTPDIHTPLTDAPVSPYSIVPPHSKALRHEVSAAGFTPAERCYDERIIPITELIQRMVREVGKLTVEQNKAIKARWAKGVTATEADEIINNCWEVIKSVV